MAEYEITSVKVSPLNMETPLISFYRPGLFIIEKRRRKEMSKASKPTTYVTKQLSKKGFFLGRNKMEQISPVKQDSKEYLAKKKGEIAGTPAL